MDFVVDLGVEPDFLTNGVPIQVFFNGLKVPNLIRVAVSILKPPDAGCLAAGDFRVLVHVQGDGRFPLGMPVDYSGQTGNPADHGGLFFGKLTGFGIQDGPFDRLPILIFQGGDVITHNLSISAF
ncbi:MAG: hypothetical protein WC865_11300 [Bacteroidales bacterium]